MRKPNKITNRLEKLVHGLLGGLLVMFIITGGLILSDYLPDITAFLSKPHTEITRFFDMFMHNKQ